jgi:hypothetical protein
MSLIHGYTTGFWVAPAPKMAAARQSATAHAG